MAGSAKARQILSELLGDNGKFLSGDSVSQSILSSAEKRQELADNGQAPVAAIVACADSRVAPEIAFAAGIGRLFVIRNAGNVATEQSVTGSLEYAVNNLNVPLVIVLGHSKCGAVTAAMGMAKDGIPDSPASPLLGHVAVIADVVKSEIGSADEVANGITTNVKHNVAALKAAASPISSAFSAGDIDIVGAIYDISSGEVYVVDE